MSWTTAQQESLLNLIQQRNEYAILQKQLDRTQKELATREQEQAVLRRQWQHEQADVDRLNRLSWASIFYDVLNSKEQQISKEKAEAQQAQLRYDVICDIVDDLRKQCADQAQRLTQYAGVEGKYEQLVQEKRIAVGVRTDEAGSRYQYYLSDLTRHNHYLQELDEAHKAGLNALDEIMRLRKLLHQARNWGTWDVLGGSAFSSMIKYQKLDDVRDQSYRVTQRLEMFRAEYADLNQAFLADWQFDNNLTRFVDIFFDNVFTDWSVQSRIGTALQTARALENQLVMELTSLKNQREQTVEQAKQKADELQYFLEKI